MNRRSKTIALALTLLLGASVVAHFTGWSAKAMEESRALGQRLTKLIATNSNNSKTATSRALPAAKSCGKLKAAAAPAPMGPAMFAATITVD